MTISSMTGYARAHGEVDSFVWAWELKSVNGRGLDIRVRVPGLMESVEIPARKHITARLARGSVTAALEFRPASDDESALVDEERLAAIMAICKRFEGHPGIRPPSLDGLLALRGVMERSRLFDEDQRARIEAAVIEGLDRAIDDLVVMRRAEGAELAPTLEGHLNEMAALAQKAGDDPASQLDAIRARIAEQIAALMEGAEGPDDDRLAQEAALIAIRQDIREEIDRMAAHVEAAQKLLNAGGVAGRKLDFLSQEMNREANTICSKAASATLKETGLEMKAIIDQFREQLQNIE